MHLPFCNCFTIRNYRAACHVDVNVSKNAVRRDLAESRLQCKWSLAAVLGLGPDRNEHSVGSEESDDTQEFQLEEVLGETSVCFCAGPRNRQKVRKSVGKKG